MLGDWKRKDVGDLREGRWMEEGRLAMEGAGSWPGVRDGGCQARLQLLI
jgi:hypothetical protein